MPAAPPLTNLQRELLDLFALDLPEDELREIQRLLARHFAEKATAGFDAFADEQGLSPEDTDRWTYEYRRASTGHGKPASAKAGGVPAPGRFLPETPCRQYRWTKWVTAPHTTGSRPPLTLPPGDT